VSTMMKPFFSGTVHRCCAPFSSLGRNARSWWSSPPLEDTAAPRVFLSHQVSIEEIRFIRQDTYPLFWVSEIQRHCFVDSCLFGRRPLMPRICQRQVLHLSTDLILETRKEMTLLKSAVGDRRIHCDACAVEWDKKGLPRASFILQAI
jgi:hypothetical protein